jgi:hypothetical protein
MKQRTITTKEQLDKAVNDMRMLGHKLPLVITVTEGTRLRTSGQNARYWSEIEFFMQQITQAVDRVADHTGYSPLEVKRLIAEELPIEQAVILFARNKEVVHDILKEVCGIPTSTRLGTKAFSKFEERLAQLMTEILGNINAITRRATG